MHNVLIDSLPEEYEGYEIDVSYQTAIQIQDILNDGNLTAYEAVELAINYLFPEEQPPEEMWLDSLVWWLNGWTHDNIVTEDDTQVMDFGYDQWRIVSAFQSQYGIDITSPDEDMHWWRFMGLLSTLNECAFTRACDIRSQTIESGMDEKERSRIIKLKQMYSIISEEQREAIEDEKQRILSILDGEG